MTPHKKLSIVDTPQKAGEPNNFQIDKYINGLVKFIENANTPITIALQGEWGSGKTSLMNTLKHRLCSDGTKKFEHIWLNTWQYSLMKEPEDTLISIIKGLIDDVSEKTTTDYRKDITIIFKKFLKFGLKAAYKVGTGETLEDKDISLERETTVLDLRKKLNEIIKSIVQEKKIDGVIFFIDDLDRLEPSVAVRILELLKNIFDLDNTIFVLAIDYDVVIKGLEPKFGKYEAKNEREFRSFFDKIIQLPFTMPLSSYIIDDFLVDNLISVGFLNEKFKEDKELKALLSTISRLSVGSNPRSLKRLLNSLSLIKCINSCEDKANVNSEDESFEKLRIIFDFALVNIQIAYPPIYNALIINPDFTDWNESLALKLDLPVLEAKSLEKLKNMNEFDEVWEQVLFRICENDFHLKKNALNASQLLNTLKDTFPKYCKDSKIKMDEFISESISLASVTNISSTEASVKVYEPIALLTEMRDKIIENIKNKYPDNNFAIEAIGNVGKQASLKINGFEIQIKAPSENGKEYRLIVLGIIDKSFDAKKHKELLDREFYCKVKDLKLKERYHQPGSRYLYNYFVKPKQADFLTDDFIVDVSRVVVDCVWVLGEINKL